MLPRTFLTPRLLAEALRPEDEASVHRMHRDAKQMAFLGGVRDEAQTSAYMERNLEHWERYGFGLWLLRERAARSESPAIGRVLLRHLAVEGRDEIEVGYSLSPACWGAGLATEAAAACLALARDLLMVDSVVALTAPDNLQSHRVLGKVGMVLEREIVHEGSPLALFRTSSREEANRRADAQVPPQLRAQPS